MASGSSPGAVFDANMLRQFAGPVDLLQKRLRALADHGWDVNTLYLLADGARLLADRAVEHHVVDLGNRLYQLHQQLETIVSSGDVPDDEQATTLLRQIAGLNDYGADRGQTPEFRNTVTTRRLRAIQLPEPEIDVSGLPSVSNVPHFVTPPAEFLPSDSPLSSALGPEAVSKPARDESHELAAESTEISEAPEPLDTLVAHPAEDSAEQFPMDDDLAAELDQITRDVAFDKEASQNSDAEIEALFEELDLDIEDLESAGPDAESEDLGALFADIESTTSTDPEPAEADVAPAADLLEEIEPFDARIGEMLTLYVLHGGDGTTATLTEALDPEFEVQSFTDPEDFLEILGAIGPDGVIMDDAHLDQIDNVAPIVRKLRAKTHGQLPLIVFSAQCDVRVRLQLMRAGVDAFVPADLPLSQVLERVREHLQAMPDEPYRILIAEDDRSQAMFAESILNRAGMRARIETDPLAVVASLDAFQPDLILMDLHMPGCDGMELTAIIRENPGFVHTPIVFLSGEEDEDIQFDALLAGGDDFLSKPVRPRHLISAVKNRVRRARSTLPAAENAPEPAAQEPLVEEPVSEPQILDRKSMGAAIEAQLAKLPEMPTDRSGGLLFLEIDRAYGIRRQHGLPFLETLAEALEPMVLAGMRAADRACHYGDAAWCLLYHDLSIGELEGKAREVLGTIGKTTFDIHGTQTRISASVGICPLSDEFEDAQALISTAERICSHDAESDDGRIGVHRPPAKAAGDDLHDIGEAITAALDDDGFQMVYQPIASLQGQEVDQYQCLLRLPRANGLPLAPAKVIAAAAELGMLDQIDRWVLDKAIDLIATDSGRTRPLRLFVNQSGEAATGSDAADWITESLEKHHISGPSLILEFKLSELARSLKAVVELARSLEQKRVRFCLGHFDGSETAFRILDYFRAEFVKLRPEVAFRQLQEGTLSDTVARLHEHQAQVIVTGVEEAQLAVQLWSAGADFIQGHFVQKPESDLSYHFSGAG